MGQRRGRMTFAAGVAAGFAVAAGLLAAGGLAAGLGFDVTPDYFFGGKMVRAEVVVKDGGVTHDFWLDRGNVKAVSSSSITLRERTGGIVTIPVASSASVRVNGRPVALSQLHKGQNALVVRDGAGAAATWVRATGRP